MIDAGLTALVTILVIAGYCLAIFLCALVWRIVADWVQEHIPHRRRAGVRIALHDVDDRRAAREISVRDRRALR